MRARQVADLDPDRTDLGRLAAVRSLAALNNAAALDARTGRPIWRYARTLPNVAAHCTVMANRGFAMKHLGEVGLTKNLNRNTL